MLRKRKKKLFKLQMKLREVERKGKKEKKLKELQVMNKGTNFLKKGKKHTIF